MATLTRSLLFVLRAAIAGLALAYLFLLLRPASGPTADGPRASPDSYAGAVAAAAPAVVNIFTSKYITQRPTPLLDDPLFRRFFGPALTGPEKRLETSLGSGVIVRADGHILTNHHVIESADEIAVTLHDGRQVQAHVVGSDPESDVAVLRLANASYPAIALADSERIAVGDVVLAIGNPYGVGQTVTQGIVSATGRNRVGINTFENFIQTDAAVNPGNSGGALVNARGELVGINTAIVSHSGGSQGISFAIPARTAVQVMEQILETGQVRRGWLGIEVHDPPPALIDELGLNGSGAVIVERVLAGGPAHLAGVRAGDLISHILDAPVSDARTARDLIARVEPGTAIPIRLRRAGRALTVQVQVGQRPSPPA